MTRKTDPGTHPQIVRPRTRRTFPSATAVKLLVLLQSAATAAAQGVTPPTTTASVQATSAPASAVDHGADTATPPLLNVRVVGVSAVAKTIELLMPRGHDVRANQLAIVHVQGVPIATARIRDVAGEKGQAGLEWIGLLPAPQFEAVVLQDGVGTWVRDRLPEYCNPTCRVLGVDSGAKQLRIDARAADGFRVGDQMFALRSGLPIARLELQRFDADGAMAACTPLVTNVAPVQLDQVQLVHGPGELRSGRLRARVLRVTAVGADHDLWFPRGANDGSAIGDRWIIRSDDEEIGLAVLKEQRGHFAVARATAAHCRRAPRVGDVVVRRLGEDVLAGRIALRILRVEGTHCHINAGTADGLTLGREMLVRRADKTVGRIKLSDIDVDSCRGEFVPAERDASNASAAAVSDEVYAGGPQLTRQMIGRVRWLAAADRVALVSVASDAPLQPGHVLEVALEGESVAVLVCAAGPAWVTVFVPGATTGAATPGAGVFMGGEPAPSQRTSP